jgi:hypothetical protein
MRRDGNNYRDINLLNSADEGACEKTDEEEKGSNGLFRNGRNLCNAGIREFLLFMYCEKAFVYIKISCGRPLVEEKGYPAHLFTIVEGMPPGDD